MRTWLALLAIAAVLAGCGVFFALHDLSTANEYASIASFFLALLTGAGSVLSLTRSKPKAQNDNGGKKKPRNTHGGTINVAYKNGVVLQGKNRRTKIVVDQRPGRKPRRIS